MSEIQYCDRAHKIGTVTPEDVKSVTKLNEFPETSWLKDYVIASLKSVPEQKQR